MKQIVYVDEQGNDIAEVFDEVPHHGEIVTLEHPVLGGRVDYVVDYSRNPPHRWYVDNGARDTRSANTPRPAGLPPTPGVKITLMPVGAVRVTVREPTTTAATDIPHQAQPVT